MNKIDKIQMIYCYFNSDLKYKVTWQNMYIHYIIKLELDKVPSSKKYSNAKLEGNKIH